jgi:hypothetical protein
MDPYGVTIDFAHPYFSISDSTRLLTSPVVTDINVPPFSLRVRLPWHSRPMVNASLARRA